MENNIRKVRFMATQGAEDLFLCFDNGRIYCRQLLSKGNPSFVRWCSTSKWSGGYEADAPLKAGMKICVTDPAGKEVLFSESVVASDYYCGSVAEKKGPFTDEAYRSAASKIREAYRLTDYEQWKAWLSADKRVYAYRGSGDNWLFAEADLVNSAVIDRIKILGYEFPVIAQAYTHRISGKKWVYCCLTNPWQLGSSTVAICGYQFEGQED